MTTTQILLIQQLETELMNIYNATKKFDLTLSRKLKKALKDAKVTKEDVPYLFTSNVMCDRVLMYYT